MHLWLAQLFLWHEVDHVHPTTRGQYSSHSRFDDPQSQWDALVQNRGVPEMGDVLGETEYIWHNPSSIIFRRYVSHLQCNYYCWAQNPVQRGALPGHLLIGMVQSCSCPVHAWDVDQSMFLSAGEMIEPAENLVWTKMDAMDSIVLSTFDACYTMHLVCHTLSPPHFPLQLPANEPLSVLDQGYGRDQAAEGLYVFRWKYLQVVVHPVRCLWVDH